MAAQWTLLSSTKPSVISRTWFKESPFNTEIRDLLDNKSVEGSSRIAHFFRLLGLMASSVLLVGPLRRLLEIDFDTNKHPIVLDARHTFVKLFLWHTHLKNHHQGINYLQSKVQERYAILKLRSTLRSIKSNSVLFRKFCAATIQPIMADLSNVRFAYQSPPFTNTGVDYFGPFYVTVRRTTEKRWGFLFTCRTTRAVHVEVVPSMDTSSCVMGVERFVQCRGRPAMIWSHNGTNLIGAEKELRECSEKWSTINTSAELARKGNKWRFNLKSAPLQGGIWGWLVRRSNRVLYTILSTRRHTDELLNTTFCLVEYALNSRPQRPKAPTRPTQAQLRLINFYLVTNQQKFRPLLALTSSIILSGIIVRSLTPMQFVHVGSRSTYLL